MAIFAGTYGILTGSQHADTAFDLHITAGNLVMAGDINAGSMGDGYSKHDRTTNIAVNVIGTAETDRRYQYLRTWQYRDQRRYYELGRQRRCQ